MQLTTVRLLVSDFPAARRFWCDVMGFAPMFEVEEMGYAYFTPGGMGLEIVERTGFAAALGEEPTASEAPARRESVVIFKVEDVDATYAELIARGAPSVTQPQARPEWGVRAAHVSDPDGHLIEIYTSLQPEGTPTA